MSCPRTTATGLFLNEFLSCRTGAGGIEVEYRTIVASQVKYPVARSRRDEQAADAGAISFMAEVRINGERVKGGHHESLVRIVRVVRICQKRIPDIVISRTFRPERFKDQTSTGIRHSRPERHHIGRRHAHL